MRERIELPDALGMHGELLLPVKSSDQHERILQRNVVVSAASDSARRGDGLGPGVVARRPDRSGAPPRSIMR